MLLNINVHISAYGLPIMCVMQCPCLFKTCKGGDTYDNMPFTVCGLFGLYGKHIFLAPCKRKTVT